MKDTTAKLEQCEAALKRWTSRLTLAANKVKKLTQQRERLIRKKVEAAVPAAAKAMKEAVAKVQVETDHISELDLPAFLDRRNPDGIRKAAREMQEAADAQLVDKLKAQRADQVEADKHKMPLTGRAAIDYLKVTPKKKKAKTTVA